MLLFQFGGEKKIIENLVKPITGNPNVIMGPGDDGAVYKVGDSYQVVSSDMYVDGDHFSTNYFTPLQIGKKVAEASISDIAAMGGKAQYLFLNISLKRDMKMSFVRSIFRGVYHSCDNWGVLLMGGDMVKSSKMHISMTVIGTATPENLRLRSGAKPGDLIKVTGEVGGASAGYLLFKKNFLGHEASKLKHLEPSCRLDLVDQIAPYATAMQDISDGLGSEIKHIAESSQVGAEIDKEKIPINEKDRMAAKALKVDVYDLALYGGEDYELVYTVSPENAEKTPGIEVGRITEGKEIVLIDKINGRTEVKEGFQHF